MKRVIVSVTNNLVSDQRVERVCHSLHQWGYKVILVGRNWPGGPPPERDYPCRRLKLVFTKKAIFYAEFNIRLFFFLLFRKADILIANDLDTLPANFLISKIKRAKLYFDSHEYFSETPEVYRRKFVRRCWLFIEMMLIKGCDGYYTVSSSLADIYKQKYGIKLGVVRNVPFRQLSPKKEDNGDKIILYQGSLNVGRGLELMIRTLPLLSHARLIIAGQGPELSKLIHLVNTLNLHKEVTFTGNLAPDALKGLTVTASVGISIEEAVGKSYKAALPNKLFDYIQARVPVLVSDLPEMKAIVEQYEVGEVLCNREPANLAVVLNNMMNNEVKRKIWKEKLEIAACELCWEREEIKLKEILVSG